MAWIDRVREALPTLIAEVTVVSGCGDCTVRQFDDAHHVALAGNRPFVPDRPRRTIRLLATCTHFAIDPDESALDAGSIQHPAKFVDAKTLGDARQIEHCSVSRFARSLSGSSMRASAVFRLGTSCLSVSIGEG
jgi:hypothetical protein